MPGLFYFVRHGQTDANLQGLMCGGAWDLGLNEQGLQQAAEAATRLKTQAVRTICTSPLLRAKKTAHTIAELQSLAVTILEIPELKEWDIGNWDRVPFESVKHEFLGSGEPKGGETRAQFQSRVRAGFQRCLEQEGPTLIVSHGGVWLALQEFLSVPPTRVENGVPHKVWQDATGAWSAAKI